MTRLLKVVPTTLLLVLAVTSPAYATFSEWLDKLGELSGPGPFAQRYGIAVDLWCSELPWWEDPARHRSLVTSRNVSEAQVISALGDLANDPLAITTALQKAGTNEGPLRGLFETDREATAAILRQRARTLYWELREKIIQANGLQKPEDVLRQTLEAWKADATKYDNASYTKVIESLNSVFAPWCTGDLRRPRQSVGVYNAWFTTDEVPTDYVYAADVASLGPRINAIPVAAMYKRSIPGVSAAHPLVLRSYDLGVSGGFMIFHGDRLPKTLVSPYLEFPRIIFRPLAMVACERRTNGCPGEWTTWDLLEIEVLGKVLPGFNAEDFGAVAGPSSDWHYQWAVRIGLSVKFNADKTRQDLVK